SPFDTGFMDDISIIIDINSYNIVDIYMKYYFLFIKTFWELNIFIIDFLVSNELYGCFLVIARRMSWSTSISLFLLLSSERLGTVVLVVVFTFTTLRFNFSFSSIKSLKAATSFSISLGVERAA